MKALGCIFYTEVSSLTHKQRHNESVQNTSGGMNARNYMPPCFVHEPQIRGTKVMLTNVITLLKLDNWESCEAVQ